MNLENRISFAGYIISIIATSVSMSADAPRPLVGAVRNIKAYLEEWIENHSRKLRPGTVAGYKGHIKNHIVIYIDHVQLNQVTASMLEDLRQQFLTKGFPDSSIRYVERVLSLS